MTGIPVAPRDRVRVVLTPDGTTELARVLGPGVVEAEGQVTHVDSEGAITMAVEVVQLRRGLRQPWSGEGLVAIPKTYQESVTREILQKRKSVWTGIAISVGAVLLALVAFNVVGSQGGDGGIGPPPPPPP